MEMADQYKKDADALITARDEVFRKVGRNLLRFQQVERMLKGILAIVDYEGDFADLSTELGLRQEKYRKKMMGQLVSEFNEKIYSVDESGDEYQPDDLQEFYVSYKVRIDADSKNHDLLGEKISEMLNDRNELVHHFLSGFPLTSMADCIAASDHLDQMVERIEFVLNILKSVSRFSKALP